MSYGPGYGIMSGYGSGYGVMGGGYGLFGMIIWIVVLVAVVVGIVWLVRALGDAGHSHNAQSGRSSGLDLLEERYARAEITRDDFQQKKRDIR